MNMIDILLVKLSRGHIDSVQINKIREIKMETYKTETEEMFPIFFTKPVLL